MMAPRGGATRAETRKEKARVPTAAASATTQGRHTQGTAIRAFSPLTLVVLALALGLAGASSGAPTRPTGTLQFSLTITQEWRIGREYCPPGTPASTNCLESVGVGEVAGLGRVTVTYTKLLPGGDPSCFMIQNNTALIEVAGKGALELSRPGRVCASGPPPRVDGPFEFSFSKGSGRYAGAMGTLVYKSAVGQGSPACQCGRARDTWSGTLTVSGVEFDVTRPELTGAVSKTVRAPNKAKRVRVRYTVTAKDAVDGPVPVLCTPRSGSYFRLGRTKVACSASDSSSNRRRARFTITVKRQSR